MTRKRFLLLCLCASLGGFGAVRVAQAARDPAGPYKKLDVFSHVLSLIENNYVEQVDETKLLYGAIEGMVRTLDPHSTFMDPRSYGQADNTPRSSRVKRMSLTLVRAAELAT